MKILTKIWGFLVYLRISGGIVGFTLFLNSALSVKYIGEVIVFSLAAALFGAVFVGAVIELLKTEPPSSETKKEAGS